MSIKKPLVIGIAGGSASGKSTFCSYLENEFSNYSLKVYHSDDYFKEEKPKIVAPFKGIEYEDHNHPTTIDFDKLNKDFSASLLENFDIIIVEGHLTLHFDFIREHLDLKIFIDCQSDERLIRRIKRNLEYGLTFDEISTIYLDCVRYRHHEFVELTRWHADIVLNGSTMPQTGTDVVVTWIYSHL